VDFLRNLFDGSRFMPHGHCYLWQSEILWTTVVSNALIALAYYSIPLALLVFVRRRKDVHFPFIFKLFSCFIAACGTTHLINTWTIWHPVYRVEAMALLFTGLVSVATSVAVWKLLPTALSLPGAAQLAQAQKLESIGRLASGVAREIEAPGRAVSEQLALLERSFVTLSGALEKARFEGLAASVSGDVELMERSLAKSREAVARITKVASALQLIAHPESEQRESIDLNLALDGTLTMSSGAWRDVADLETSFGPGLEAVPCLPGQLNQAILNIVVNAAEAISERHEATGARGLIRIATSRSGDRAVVEVADDGAGMPDTVQSRLFEPLFTTKGPGRGHGLSLARAVVVDRHGGTLSVDSAPLRGTRVRIEIPFHGASDPRR
jgi:two-component system, NtrC family, sensor kinase